MGASFGVSAKGQNGEMVFNHVADLSVPAPIKNAVKKAVQASSKATAAGGDAAKAGAGFVAKQVKNVVKNETSKLKKELKQFGEIDIDSHLNPDERSAILNYLRDGARKKQGKVEASDVPEVDGHSSYGTTVSNGNVNSAMKFVGGSAFLPTNGNMGVYLYVDDFSKKVSGFAATLKWELP
jgi:hypothetical protein